LTDPEEPEFEGELFGDRRPHGDGAVTISGERKTWHRVIIDLDGPFAHERDNKPNPFTDYRYEVVVANQAPGGTQHRIRGYFAADGNAGETSAESGTCWRANFVPDAPGEWTYRVEFSQGPDAALDPEAGVPDRAEPLAPYHLKNGSSIEGTFTVAESDKTGRDLRAHGFLTRPKDSHYLRFQGSDEYFLKAGADAPETLLAFKDFDGTVTNNPQRGPLKSWGPHVRDWQPGDPTWQGGKGKGLVGAINYLAGTGCNAFSFLTYNAGGDGDNVWPFRSRRDTLHYDCSKLDQWGRVFDHATARGMFLHFKLQETENDDLRKKGGKENQAVPCALDGGKLGRERKLYLKEIVARYGHCLALNWNLGEENTQTTEEQMDQARYIAQIDGEKGRALVIHSYPDQQEKVYGALLAHETGTRYLNGASLQNSNVSDCHHQVVKWRNRSAQAGNPWIISFDEPGNASEGTPADPGYPGMPDNFDNPSIDTVRKHALWGTLMAGGTGVEYYFGYKLPQNDLVCEDWRSRDQTFRWSAIALQFFRDEKIPFWQMRPADDLVGNEKHDNSVYCLAKEGEVYLVYLPEGGSREIDLAGAAGDLVLRWFNPRSGEWSGAESQVSGGAEVRIQAPAKGEDWLGVIR